MIIEVAALVGFAGLVALGCIGVLCWGHRRPSKAGTERRVSRWAGWRRPGKAEGRESNSAAAVVHAELQDKAQGSTASRRLHGMGN